MGERGKKVAVDAYYNEAVEKSDKTLLMCNFDRISAVKILLKYQLFPKIMVNCLFVFFTPNNYIVGRFTTNGKRH